MASVASLASAPAPAARAQAKDRLTSAAALPVDVKSLSPRYATQPNPALPAFNPDPMPIITEFYGPAKVESSKPAPKPPSGTVPEAAIRTNTPSAQ
jgi:hypothetical protein